MAVKLLFLYPIDALLIFAVLTPAIGWLSHQLGIRLRELFATLGFVVAGSALYLIAADYWALDTPTQVVVDPFTPPLGACLIIDRLAIFMSAVFIGLGLLVSVYSARYMEHDESVSLYYALLLAMVGGMVGVAFAGDFFTLFVFWELMAISSYVLVAFRKHLWEPVEAGFKYLIMSAAGTGMILFAFSMLYGVAGTLNFAYLSQAMSNGALVGQGWVMVALALLIAGFGVKAAIVPLHTWLPDAHPAAPSPISAMLSGVVIKTGVLALIRTLFLIFSPTYGFNWSWLILGFAILTMTVGNLMALVQDDIKRLLAFSSVAQIGYIVFAIGIAGYALSYGLSRTIAALALGAALLHVLNHALMKGLLFLCAGSFLHASGTRSLSKLSGIAHKMPASGVILFIAGLAISGIPLFNGFISELLIVISAFMAQLPLLAFAMLLNVLLGFGYYLRMIRVIVWQEPLPELAEVKESPVSMVAPMALMALLCIVIGIYPYPFVDVVVSVAQTLLSPSAFVASLTA